MAWTDTTVQWRNYLVLLSTCQFLCYSFCAVKIEMIWWSLLPSTQFLSVRMFLRIGTGNGNVFFHLTWHYRNVCYVFYSQASQTIMDSNKSTALFEIPYLSSQQGGLWECRVSTNGGQDSRKFNLTIKGLYMFFFKKIIITIIRRKG